MAGRFSIEVGRVFPEIRQRDDLNKPRNFVHPQAHDRIANIRGSFSPRIKGASARRHHSCGQGRVATEQIGHLGNLRGWSPDDRNQLRQNPGSAREFSQIDRVIYFPRGLHESARFRHNCARYGGFASRPRNFTVFSKLRVTLARKSPANSIERERAWKIVLSWRVACSVAAPRPGCVHAGIGARQSAGIHD